MSTSSNQLSIDIDFPEALQFLFQPSRYKVVLGGRGGSKSWGIARALLLLGTQKPLRILCAREFQGSIEDSVHALLKSQIIALGLSWFYSVEQKQIIGQNGTRFTFAGIKSNPQKISSTEGVDICWVEEAANVSKASWQFLIPTIRKDGSEIWISYNPQLETDETHQRFSVRPPAQAIVRRLTWRDNPWFPAVLKAEMEELRERDMDAYLNVWEGQCLKALDGAVYAVELRLAEEEGRFCKVPYDRLLPVHTFWDLGWSDSTSIWFAQVCRGEYRIIDHLSDSRKAISHYQKVLQDKGYIYGTHHLPHDARAKSLGTGKSIEEILRAAGSTVKIVPQLSIADGINAVRTIFPNLYFDSEKCCDGINALRHYRYDKVDETTLSRVPLHDWASHDADGLRYLAVSLKADKPKTPLPAMREMVFEGTGSGWMGV